MLGGPVDVLVNNAFATGSTFGTSVFDVDDAAWSEVLDVNLLGPFRLARAFGKKMLQGGRGSIINVVSGSGFLPTPTLAPYGASKAALWMLTRYLAAEGAPTVRANAICPGLIERAGQDMTGGQRALLSQVPMGRLGQPREVAGAAVYLASDASSYTTGEVIFVNGGRPW
jgi:NAD(P)-dependent dehydrogenase (short-subunit alcohol dehydrogenase family)